MQYLQEERLLILGLGVSGLSMVRWAVRCGASVRVADTRMAPLGLEALQQLVPGLDFVSGDFDAAVLLSPLNGKTLTRILRSPGLMPHDAGVQAVMQAAQLQDIAVWGELDMFTEALVQIDEHQKAQGQEKYEEHKECEKREKCPVELGQAVDVLAVGTQTGEPDLLATGLNSDTSAPLDHDGVSGEEAQGGNEHGDDMLDEAPLPVLLPPAVTGYQPKIIAITGTNGKTTVTALTAQLVERAGKSVVAAGNIGPAVLDTLAEKLDSDSLPQVWVLELSSFQLDGVRNFDPAAATVLNLTQDHLDWHGSMEAYAKAKGHVFGKNTVRVLNRDDVLVMDYKPVAQLTQAVEETAQPKKRTQGKAKGKAKDKENAEPRYLTFGLDAPVVPGDFGIVEDGDFPWLVLATATDETRMDTGVVSWQRLMPLDVLRIRGRHNAANALAALALASSVGCDIAPMLFGLREYRGEPHRVESVAIVNGVEYVDDSKGTNVGATAAALAGLGTAEHKLVMILGGDGKGQDFSPLAPLVAQYVRTVALIGRDAALIEKALHDTGVAMQHVASMDEAVHVCAQAVQPGDVVLMSPACASLDMFKNYVERAKAFVDAVYALAQDQGQVMGGGL